MRADSAVLQRTTIQLDGLDRLKVPWSITIALYGHVKAAIGAIPEAHWTPIAYPRRRRSARR